ncbi:MAG: hypothetical protein Kow00121_65030 [Elainellaceae cyanobacterium]
MSTSFEYITLSSSDDAQHLGNILAQCFNSPPQDNSRYMDRVGSERFRAVRQNSQIVGGLATIPMHQWWGKQLVPMTGIAAVGIAPEARGSGAAIALLQHTLQELYDTGVPISVLYPATQRLYRKAGYEQGGTYTGWTIPTTAIQVKAQPLPIQAIAATEAKAFLNLQQQHAQRHNGHLDRHPALWQETLESVSTEPTYAFQIGALNQPEGYIIYSQHRVGEENIIRIRDWAILTPAAGHSLWTFLANHRSQVAHIRWRSSPIDLLSLLLPEQTAETRSTMRWMLRIVNVGLALEKRGYPLELETELHLDVRDEWLAGNNGKFVLSVANGTGKITQGGRGDLQLDIRGLAPLYTGLFSPQQLQLTGYLTATDAALAIATQLFAGSAPWLPDFF